MRRSFFLILIRIFGEEDTAKFFQALIGAAGGGGEGVYEVKCYLRAHRVSPCGLPPGDPRHCEPDHFISRPALELIHVRALPSRVDPIRVE
jgi:hypothetical protein